MFYFSPQPQSIWRIFSQGTQLFKNTFLKIWPWQIVWLLPLLILSLLDNKLALDKIALFDSLSSSGGILLITVLIIITLFAVLLPLFGHCFNTHRIYQLVVQPSSNTQNSLKAAIRKILPVIGATLIILLGFLVVEGLTAGLFFLIWQMSGALAIIAAILLSVPLILAAVFVLLLLTFYLQLIILDNCGIFNSIKQSCKLVWGNWWRNFIILFGLTVVVVVISLISFMIPIPTLRVVVNILLLSILYPWYFSVLLTQFNDLKVRQQRKTLLQPNP